MKPENLRIPLYVALFLWFLLACTSSVKINVIQPGLLTLPKTIDTMAIINRFIPSSNYSDSLHNSVGFNNNYASSAFGDLYYFNLAAFDSCLGSLFYILGYSPRFKEVLTRKEMLHDGNNFFPPVLDPSVVQSVCQDYHSQALVVLEGFYSNSSISTQMHSRQVSYQVPYYVNGRTYYRTAYRTEYYYTATLSVFYSAGFRLYQSLDGSLLDENRIDRTLAYTRTSSTRSGAIYLLPSRNYIIHKIASVIAINYAQRISPLWKTVSRKYFTTANKMMEEGAQFAEQHNWEEARKAWEMVYLNGKPVQQGLAAMNIALTYEIIEEDLNKARDMANQSYDILNKRHKSDYANTAGAYVDTLNTRIAIIPILNEQLTK